MNNDYQLNLKKDMALSIQLGNNSMEAIGEEVEEPYINTPGTDAINIAGDFICIIEDNKLFLRIKPEMETEGDRLYKLHIPAAWDQDLAIEANNGRVNLTGLKGTLKVITVHGQVKIKDLAGKIMVTCSTGGIEGETINGQVDIATSNGKVMLTNAGLDGGSVKSNNGDMALHITPGAAGSLNIFSGNGNIDLALPGNGSYLVKVQTKGKLNNHLKDCTVVSDNEVTSVQMGEAAFAVGVIHFKGEVRLMDLSDFGKDWSKKDNGLFGDFKIGDPAKFIQDLFTRDYSKDIPDMLKKLGEFGSQVGKFGDDLVKKMQKGNTKDDEVKLILEMLQQGKISTEDAERLINAIKKK